MIAKEKKEGVGGKEIKIKIRIKKEKEIEEAKVGAEAEKGEGGGVQAETEKRRENQGGIDHHLVVLKDGVVQGRRECGIRHHQDTRE